MRNPILKCNNFKEGIWNSGTAQGESIVENKDDISRIFIIINQNRLIDYSTDAQALESFKTWLSTNNTTVYYPLAQENLINLNTKVDIRLFKGANTVTNSEDCNMTIQYY